MRRLAAFAFVFALLPALSSAQPDEEDDGDVADEAAPAAPASAVEEPPRRSRRARAEAPPEGEDEEEAADPAAGEGDAKADKADAKGDKADKADKADPKADKADPKAEPPKKILSEKVVEENRPGPRLRAASAEGPIGLDRVWSADPGPEGAFRLKLAMRYFAADAWPIADAAGTTFTGTALGISYTPLAFLETFVVLKSTSSDNPDGRPTLIQTQGDVDVGFKLGHFFTNVIAAGFGAQLHILGGLGASGANFDGLSYEFRGLFTADLQKGELAPLRVLLDVGYYLENGEAVYADEAQEPDLIQEWGLQAWRYNRLTVGLGVEVPVAPYASPFLEYRIGTPFEVEVSRRGRGALDFDFASVPHSVAGGVRAFPLPELGLDAALRLGLSDKPFTGVMSTPPWEVVFGLSYTLDPRPKIIEREVAGEKPVVVDTTLALGGKVVDEDDKPIAGARVSYSGRNIEVSPQVSDEDGRFAGYRFAPGEVKVRAEADGFAAKSVKTTLDGKEKKLKIKLKRDASRLKGRLEVRAFDAKGKAMGATAVLDDADKSGGEIKVDAPLMIEAAAGRFTLEVSTKGFKTLRQQVEVKGGETTEVRISMQKGSGVVAAGGDAPREAAPREAAPRAEKPEAAPRTDAAPADAATLKGKRVVPKGKVEFAEGKATLTGGGRKALDSVATLLKSNGKLKLRIGVHTDNAGDAGALKTLTGEQAQAAKAFLVSRGVAAARITAEGFGGERPIAPNVSARGRSQNRRVDLEVME